MPLSPSALRETLLQIKADVRYAHLVVEGAPVHALGLRALVLVRRGYGFAAGNLSPCRLR